MKNRLRTIETKIKPSHRDVIICITGLPGGPVQHCYLRGQYHAETGNDLREYPADRVINVGGAS